jgi:hypothetical protein
MARVAGVLRDGLPLSDAWYRFGGPLDAQQTVSVTGFVIAALVLALIQGAALGFIWKNYSRSAFRFITAIALSEFGLLSLVFTDLVRRRHPIAAVGLRPLGDSPHDGFFFLSALAIAGAATHAWMARHRAPGSALARGVYAYLAVVIAASVGIAATTMHVDWQTGRRWYGTVASPVDRRLIGLTLYQDGFGILRMAEPRPVMNPIWPYTNAMFVRWTGTGRTITISRAVEAIAPGTPVAPGGVTSILLATTPGEPLGVGRLDDADHMTITFPSLPLADVQMQWPRHIPEHGAPPAPAAKP